MRALLFLIFSLMALPALAERERLRFEAGGHMRAVELVIPDPRPEGPAPLVLSMSGYTQSPAGWRRVTRNQFDTLAHRTGYVVAYPIALAGDWDFGVGRSGARVKPARDDIGFLIAAIDAVATRVEIDRDRVFLSGNSSGALMGYALVCKYPGVLRALAAVNMPLPTDLVDDCRAAPPTSMLFIQGSRDRLAPGNSLILSGSGPLLKTTSHAETLGLFRRRAGCLPAPTATRVYDAHDDGTRVLRRDWTSCRAGLMIQSYDIENGGHTWPGGKVYFPFMGRVSREIDGAAASFAFFSRFR